MHVQRRDGCDYAFHYGSSDTVDLVVRISDLTAYDLVFTTNIHLFYFFCFIHGLGSLYIDLLKAPFKGTGETVPACDVYVAMIHVSDVRFLPFLSTRSCTL